jgi:hypothetical protein
VFPFRGDADALEHTAEDGIADADVFPLLKQFPKAGEIGPGIQGALFQRYDSAPQPFIGMIGGMFPRIAVYRRSRNSFLAASAARSGVSAGRLL